VTHVLEQVLQVVKSEQRFLLTSHARPDGDAIGSLLGASQLLRALGKSVDIVMSDPVPVIYRDLPFSDTIQHRTSTNNGYDAVIILECDGIARTGVAGLDQAARVIVNIDHHASAKPFAHINSIDTDASATGEMIFELARAAHVEITPEMATCLYAAMLTDTGSFCYEVTDARTFAFAQQLVEAGAKPAEIAREIYFANPESKMRLLGSALSNLRREGRLAWMFVTQAQMRQSGAREEDCEGLVNYALSISGVEVALFFRELPDGRYRVSLRSKGGVNVAHVAEQFGGGGHECASGCSVQGPLSVAAHSICERLSL